MITDEIMDAIWMMIDMCSNEEQKKGMWAVEEMLGYFCDEDWMRMTDAERYDWVAQYLNCERKEIDNV